MTVVPIGDSPPLSEKGNTALWLQWWTSIR